ncbi:NHL repeat-containing protein [Embleya hyalina]|uniref:SMP-30/Gluconolactonase/LRE-like region domain-containing protein n=1 Tax=Embleya hyalina TaxID=516124 RepID=A0A401Z4L9_9ACTN|nr:NHL repeat-containing protein [Embleya hyalina]GCE01801.1 hypothetical protein EHYA_09575 [Embleya hyalina]
MSSRTVSTAAGDGTAAFRDDTAASARFNWPTDVVVDAKGDLYIADSRNSRVRKLSGDRVSTAAGPPTDVGDAAGYVDGPAALARFDYPCGMAIDAKGDLYIADYTNHRIRKLSEGYVSTVAGSGTPGFKDGPAASARFNWPRDVAVDAEGNVYVADSANHRVRMISPTGDVSTAAGPLADVADASGCVDGAAASARFNSPYGVAVDADRTVYVADFLNHRVRTISAQRQVSTPAGPPAEDGTLRGCVDGPGPSARFDGPFGIAVDRDGNVYVADFYNNRVRMVSRAQVFTVAGPPAGKDSARGWVDGPAASARFNYPKGVAPDGKGRLYVADCENNRVRMVSGSATARFLVVPEGDDDARCAFANTEFLPRLKVVALDEESGPVPYVEVTFTVHGTSIATAAFPNNRSSCTALTDPDGIATAEALTAGPVPTDRGLKVEASAPDKASFVFHLSVKQK